MLVGDIRMLCRLQRGSIHVGSTAGAMALEHAEATAAYAPASVQPSQMFLCRP